MDALTALLGRSSASRLTEPAPQGAQRDRILRAALRAPDHARLRPWRFLLVEGAARAQLGEALARAMLRHQPDLDEQAQAKLRANPMRAPLLIVLLAHIVEHPKVPEIEQLLSVACAAQNMLLAAHAEGFGAIWRTGAVTYTAELHQELGLETAERVLGFLYLGSGEGPARVVDDPQPEAHFRVWPGA